MNIDEILSTSVDQLARGVTPPPPDPDRVRALARATRRRQWVAAAAGTAAVVVGGVAITSGLVDQGSAPSVDDPKPTPSPVIQVNESAIWSEARAIHLGSRQIPAPDRVFGFGLVEGGVVYTYTSDDRDSRVMYQPNDGSDATQIGDNAQVAPAGDPSSGLVSWVEARGKAGSLAVFDTTTGREVARTSVPPALRPQDNIIFPGISPVISVSSTAVYYFGRDEEIWVYRSREGGEPEPTGKTREEFFDVAGGVTAQAGIEKGSVEFVTPDGDVTATGLPPGGYLSPDGSLFASFNSEGRMPRILVADTSTGETTKLDLFGSGGERGFLFGVGWSSNDTLMVKNMVSAGSRAVRLPGQVIACTVSTGRCVVVAHARQGFFMTVPLS